MITSFDLPITERVVYELKEFFKSPFERIYLIYSYYIKCNLPWEKRKANKAHLLFMMHDIIEKVKEAHTCHMVIGYKTMYTFDDMFVLGIYTYSSFPDNRNGIYIQSLDTGKYYEMYVDKEGIEMKTRYGEKIDIVWVRSIRKAVNNVYNIMIF